MYHTILWDNQEDGKFEVKDHDTVKDAVLYLIKNGAKFDNQEIMEKVNWLPDGTKKAAPVQEELPQESDNNTPATEVIPQRVDINPGDKPSDSGVGEGQPVEINLSGPGTQSQGGSRPLSVSERMNGGAQKKSMFDGFLPPQVISKLQS